MEFNKALIDCMQTLRRRLREEQHLEIRLSQPDAIPTMISACQISQDQLTREMGRQLSAYSGAPETPEPPATPPTPTAVPERAAPSERPVRIYRGQRVLA